MPSTLISLGANLGNAKQTIQSAADLLREEFGSERLTLSRIYRSPAVGGPSGQDDFCNAVGRIESELTPFDIWQRLSRIEQNLGRQRRQRWEARRIDLDVLLHDDVRIWTPKFKVPHPRMNLRTFVLEPAAEIASELRDPVTQQTIHQLLHRMPPRESDQQFRKPKVILFVEDSQLHDDLWMFLAKYSSPSNSGASPLDLEIIKLDRLPRPHLSADVVRARASIADRLEHTQQPDVIGFAGGSPDPTTIHWEDYCRGWAEVLFISPPNSPLVSPVDEETDWRSVPKYLLAAEDPKWAAHELVAATTSMTCDIEANDHFFGDS